jgi:hypothetical protein
VGIVAIAVWRLFAADSFYVTDANWDRGVARSWAGYHVPLDKEDHAVGMQVRFRNGETRPIVKTVTNAPYRNVFVAGDPLDPARHGLPSEYRIEPAKGPPGADSFFLTDANWNRGVARRWAGFFVRSGTPGYSVGGRVTLKNGEIRTIVRLEDASPYLNVYLDGSPLDPALHGVPADYILQ